MRIAGSNKGRAAECLNRTPERNQFVSWWATKNYSICPEIPTHFLAAQEILACTWALSFVSQG